MSIHSCFSNSGWGKPPPLLSQNFYILEGPRGMSDRLGLNIKELPNHILLHVRFLFVVAVVVVVSCRKRLLKVIWRSLRQWFTLGTKNNLSWHLLLVAKPKIHFVKHNTLIYFFIRFIKSDQRVLVWKFVGKRTWKDLLLIQFH